MYPGFIFLAFCFFGGTKAVCPPAEEILPCECDESRLRFYCSQQMDNSSTPWDIKATFDRVSTLVPEGTVFDDIYITITKLKEIPAGAMQSVKFRNMTMEFNDQLEYIHPEAFIGTVETLVKFSISSSNKLNDDLFNVIRTFKSLERLSINLFNITSIPDDALGSLPNLTYFRYSGSLQNIGSRAFAGLPKLNYLGLSYSDISINEITDDAFEGIGSDAEVDLENNLFSRLPENIFKPLLDNARSVRVGGETCIPWSCTDLHLDCDVVSEWICGDVEKYRPVLKGFLCRVASAYDDIFDYCAGQSNKSTKLIGSSMIRNTM